MKPEILVSLTSENQVAVFYPYKITDDRLGMAAVEEHRRGSCIFLFIY